MKNLLNKFFICRITIGKYTFIGARVIVTEDVSDYALYLGVPVTHSGWVYKCGIVLTWKVKAETEKNLLVQIVEAAMFLKEKNFYQLRSVYEVTF